MISTLRTIVSLLRVIRRCGNHDLKVPAEVPSLLNQALLSVLKRPPGRQRPALNLLGRMPANPRVVPPAEARKPWTGEAEPHAQTDRLHNCIRSHRTLRQPTPNRFYRDIYPRYCHHSVSGAACAAAHRPMTSHRMAPQSVEQLFFGVRKRIPR